MVQLTNNLRREHIKNPNSLHPRVATIEQHVQGTKPLQFHLTPTQSYDIIAVCAEYLPRPVSFYQCFPGAANFQRGEIQIGVSATRRALDVNEAVRLFSDKKYQRKYIADRDFSDLIRGYIDEVPSSGEDQANVWLKRESYNAGPMFPFTQEFREQYEFQKTFGTTAYLNMNLYKLPEGILRLMGDVKPGEMLVWFGKFLAKKDTFNEAVYFRCNGLGVLLIDNESLSN